MDMKERLALARQFMAMSQQMKASEANRIGTEQESNLRNDLINQYGNKIENQNRLDIDKPIQQPQPQSQLPEGQYTKTQLEGLPTNYINKILNDIKSNQANKVSENETIRMNKIKTDAENLDKERIKNEIKKINPKIDITKFDDIGLNTVPELNALYNRELSNKKLQETDAKTKAKDAKVKAKDEAKIKVKKVKNERIIQMTKKDVQGYINHQYKLNSKLANEKNVDDNGKKISDEQKKIQQKKIFDRYTEASNYIKEGKALEEKQIVSILNFIYKDKGTDRTSMRQKLEKYNESIEENRMLGENKDDPQGIFED